MNVLNSKIFFLIGSLSILWEKSSNAATLLKASEKFFIRSDSSTSVPVDKNNNLRTDRFEKLMGK